MAGYTRVDTSNNIADGNVISAADLDNEFDGVQAAFSASTGHTHGGGVGEGAPITKIGPTQDVTASASLLAPKTTNTVDLGSSSLKYKDLWLAGNASITGTLGVTGVATLTAQPILSSLTASQAVFTDASKGLVSNAITGTGNVVMSASPTLTGTVALAALTASGNVTLSGGTANGVAYLNGSKVLTTGSALTFDGTNLVLGGAQRINGTSTTGLTLTSNSGSTSGFKLYNDSGTDIAYLMNFYNGSMVFGVNNAEQMRLTSTGLSIGTSTPLQKLDVRGRAGVYGASDVYQVKLSYDVGTAGFWLGSPSANALAFYNDAGTERARLDSAGNLGLGVTPSAWGSNWRAFTIGAPGQLASTVGGSSSVQLVNAAYNDNTNWLYTYTGIAAARYQQTSGSHAWFTAPSGTAGSAISFTQAMTLTAGGSLALGTTSTTSGCRLDVVGGYLRVQQSYATSGNPLLVLHTNRASLGQTYDTAVFQSDDATAIRLIEVNGSTGVATGEVTLSAGDGGATQVLGATGALVFATGRAAGTSGYATTGERARIDSSGNLLVGMTSGSRKINASFAAANGGIYLETTNADASYLYFARSGATFVEQKIVSTNFQIVNLGSGGVSLAVGGTSWGAVSDERLKTAVAPFENAAAKIASLRAGTGRYLTDDEGVSRSFLIAQDVQAVLPEAVDVSSDEQGTLSLRYTDTIPLLVAAIQEQQAIITTLTARVAAIESN